MYTRNQYIENEVSHHDFYSQFVTELTNKWILSELGIYKLLESKDENLNDVDIPYNYMGSGGGWWWDNAPINLSLAMELGVVGSNGIPAPATKTCIGKAAARILVAEHKNNYNTVKQ